MFLRLDNDFFKLIFKIKLWKTCAGNKHCIFINLPGGYRDTRVGVNPRRKLNFFKYENYLIHLK